MKTVAILVALVLVVAVGVSVGGPLCRTLVKNPAMAGELKLSADQREQLEKLFENTEKEIIEADAKMDVKRLEMGRLMRSDNPDMREIRKVVDEIGEARSASILAGIEQDVKVRQILTSEQMARAGRMVMWMDRGRRAPGPRGEPPFDRERMGMRGPEEREMRGMRSERRMMGGGCMGMQGMGSEGRMMHGGCMGMQGMGSQGLKMQGEDTHKQEMGCKRHMMKGSAAPEAEPETGESE